MNNQPENRKLSAILFTDIVGYTRQMQQDEKTALDWVRKHQQAIESMVPKFHGEIYQFYGDGCLCLFSSTQKAIQCAVEIQLVLIDQEVPLKIGINIGEVFWQDEKLYGDGVNIAARILGCGQAGTVFLSHNVYDKIRNNPELQCIILGKFRLKNVHDPVEIFALIYPGLNKPDEKKLPNRIKSGDAQRIRMWVLGALLVLLGPMLWYFSDRLMPAHDPGSLQGSIAVLPFVNATQDPKQDPLVWGIAEDILTQLSKINNLKVISRASSSKYKDSEKPLRRIANELGVSNLLEGSVQAHSDRVRVSIKLVDPFSNDQILWADDYDRDLSDILEVQREVARAVSQELQIQFSGVHKNVEPVNPEAYLNYQRGQMYLKQGSGTREELDSAEYYFRSALTVDPDYALAHIGLADTYLENLFWQRDRVDNILPQVRNSLSQALAIDPELGECYGILGALELYNGNLEEGKQNLEKAARLSPGYLFARDRLAWVYLREGRTSLTYEMMDYVIERDPLSTRYRGAFAWVFIMDGRQQEGLEFLQDYLDKYGEDDYILWAKGSIYAAMGKYEEAIDLFTQRSIGQNNWLLGYCYAKSGNTKKAEAILQVNAEKAKTSFVPSYMMAVQYLALDQRDSALYFLEKSLNEFDSYFLFWFLDKDPFWRELQGNETFEKIIRNVP